MGAAKLLGRCTVGRRLPARERCRRHIGGIPPADQRRRGQRDRHGEPSGLCVATLRALCPGRGRCGPMRDRHGERSGHNDPGRGDTGEADTGQGETGQGEIGQANGQAAKPTLAERLPALAAPGGEGRARRPRHLPVARVAQRRRPGAAGKVAAGFVSASGAAPRPVAAPGAADAAARRRELLAPPHPAGRPAGPGARRRLRPAGGLDLAPRHLEPRGAASRQKAPRQGRGRLVRGGAAERRASPSASGCAGAAVPRGAPCPGQGALLHLRPAVYRFGWHRDLWGTGTPNRNAAWHAACVVAWKFWIARPTT